MFACCLRKRDVSRMDSRIMTLDTLVGSQGVAHIVLPQNDCGYCRFLCTGRIKPEPLDVEELQILLRRLHRFCLVHVQDPYKIHMNRVKGIALINVVLQSVNFDETRATQVISLIWCTLSCVHHFYIRSSTGSSGILDWSRKKQAKTAMKTYENLIGLTLHYNFDSIIYAVVTFFSESGMWGMNDLCAELIKKLLNLSGNGEPIVHGILDVIEEAAQKNVNEARQVLRVLYQILEDYPWQSIEDELIERFLNLYIKSVMVDGPNYDVYAHLKRGLELCLKNILTNMSNAYLLKIIKLMMQCIFQEDISDDALLDFGNVLEYASLLHETFCYYDSLQSNLFPLLLELIASECRIRSLLGNRVLQHLLDRHNNKIHFDTPRIFFDDTHFNIRIGEYRSEDKAFLRKYREMIHATLLGSIQMHGETRINLESTYALIAIFVVEIPCGYTAAAVVCLAMAIQEYALSDDQLALESCHRLHATVMSVMSLVCWVHNAKVFYEYLKIIVDRRAQFAPHLNPPLRATYEYAQHHILWNKPELFFEDWEARYGLWKCFRTRKSKRSTRIEMN